MQRPILDSNGNPTGAYLELPDNTPESVWQEKLNQYKYIAPNEADARRKASIISRKEWADDLIQRFKDMNISSGININQALWLQHRMRALNITVGGIPMIMDMMNLVISGDIEVACVALQYAAADDMTQTYHWFSAGRRDWLVTEMKKYLGWS